MKVNDIVIWKSRT